MVRRRTGTKKVDEVTRVRCALGIGVIREEVWVGPDNRVLKYNLAFINHRIFNGDNGRVLGYDNAHGHHERHFKGIVEPFAFTTYEAVVETFFEEVSRLKEER